jgi:hypothetical protein
VKQCSARVRGQGLAAVSWPGLLGNKLRVLGVATLFLSSMARTHVVHVLRLALVTVGLGCSVAFVTSTPRANVGSRPSSLPPAETWLARKRVGRQMRSMPVTATAGVGARQPLPSAWELFNADFLGIRTQSIAKESYAWSHAAYNDQSLILQITAQIEEQGGKDVASKNLISARRGLFHALIRHDYAAYVRAATAVGGLVDRADLPNVQQVPHPSRTLGDLRPQPVEPALLGGSGDVELVPDCSLANVTFAENALDKALLFVFRSLVQKETGFKSPKDGIFGLLEEGREYMLRPQQTAEAQNKMVYNTLAGLMTPAMPPIYKTFMSGTNWKPWLGESFGPWPWAAALTTFITPTFFGFLVGPSRPNRRRDGALGGLVVEKCKFLQESGCKGLCLNQCKLPAQQFFSEALGLDLTVTPNFETQECQWSFGEAPLPVEEDPLFPKGCLAGCPTRAAVREAAQPLSCS